MTHKILLLEDDPDTLQLMTRHLTGHGYDVLPCASGLCAVIEYLRAVEAGEHFAALVLDCALPHFTGFTVARIVRMTEETGATHGQSSRIAFFSAFTETIEQSTLVSEVGGEKYWKKPDDIVRLPVLIEEWLSEEVVAK